MSDPQILSDPQISRACLQSRVPDQHNEFIHVLQIYRRTWPGFSWDAHDLNGSNPGVRPVRVRGAEGIANRF